MLTGIIFLLGATLVGIALVRAIGPLRVLLNHAEQVMWGLVTGWMLSTLAAYLISRVLGRLSFGPIFICAIVMWLAVAVLWFEPLRSAVRKGIRGRTIWRAEYGGLLIVLVLFAPIYVRLFASHMIQPGTEGIYSAGSTWYDIGFHLALTSSFLYGDNFPPLYTPFPPAPLLYPFLPDFQISALAALGMSLRSALLLTSIPLALAITGLLYSFARRLVTPDHEPRQSMLAIPSISAVLATIIFLLNGGFGFVYFIGDWRSSGKSLGAFWSNLNVNYANIGSRNIQWCNFIADAMLPQRSSLFGFSVALIVFTLFAVVWKASETGKAESRLEIKLLIVGGVLTGLLPLFQVHAYLGIGLVSVFLFLLRRRRHWLAFWIPAILLALPYLITIAGHVSTNSFARFTPGWRGHSESVWLWFWLRNIGLPSLLIIPAWLAAPSVWRRFYLAFAGLLLFSLLVMVSPNDFDNIKLMYLWYVPTSVLVASWLVRLAFIKRQRLLASVLALLCIASGLLALHYEDVNHNLIFTHEEMAAAVFAREQTAAHALFLTGPTFHQPILSLAGRAVLRANTAWLWSHGYEFAQREADVKSIYAGRAEARDLINYYDLDYIYLGPGEVQAGANQRFFDDSFPVVYRSPNIAIYAARSGVRGSDPTTRPPNITPREFASRLDKDPYQLLVEFPETSFAIYRLYKVAFGRKPRYEEFMKDMALIGRGLRIGTSGWQQVLEENKNRLTERWWERSDFKATFQDKTNEQYVDALVSNGAHSLPSAERDALVSALNDQSQSRGAVLRKITEASGFDNKDYNSAYVLVHYFGYFHRNPDDPPDNDMKGFNFWLNDLERTGDYRSVTRAFIESDEYDKKGVRR
ncbi:MAG TPA: hypothetical protein DC047_10110 [Blastocatellia bacterium]|nr:hypothetical protein [Blastocatellia bacterium]